MNGATWLGEKNIFNSYCEGHPKEASQAYARKGQRRWTNEGYDNFPKIDLLYIQKELFISARRGCVCHRSDRRMVAAKARTKRSELEGNAETWSQVRYLFPCLFWCGLWQDDACCAFKTVTNAGLSDLQYVYLFSMDTHWLFAEGLHIFSAPQPPCLVALHSATYSMFILQALIESYCSHPVVPGSKKSDSKHS